MKIFAGLAVLVVALPLPAAAHDWYPVQCCRGAEFGGDCDVLPASRVRVTPQGFIIDGKFTKTFSETQWSPDGLYHACFPTPDRLVCFFAPQGGT